MKGIKLTPFLLFVILLVVLILAMLFGATSSKPILEKWNGDQRAVIADAMKFKEKLNSFSLMVVLYCVSSIEYDEENSTVMLPLINEPKPGEIMAPPLLPYTPFPYIEYP